MNTTTENDLVRQCAKIALNCQVIPVDDGPCAEVCRVAVSNHLLFAYHRIMKLIEPERDLTKSICEARKKQPS